jgi:aspartate racemase
MRTVGIIGGIAPESTIAYYRQILAAYRERKADGSYPSIIINSIDLTRLLDLVGADELDQLVDYLLDELQKLSHAGADFGLLASNTPHIVFEEISRQSPIPLISIVEVTCQAAKTQGLKKLGLFGTRSTMQGRFYPETFSREGIALVVPDAKDQAYIHDRYMSELVKGIFLPETRQQLLAIVDRLKEQESIEGLILGGTELPLILPESRACGISVLDTTRIHVSAVVKELLA